MGNNQSAAGQLKWDQDKLQLVAKNTNENFNNPNYIFWNNL